MKIHLPILTLLGSLFFMTAALAAPELSVEQGSHDFGNVMQGKKAQHSFKIRNTGDEPLQIKQVTADCGCTAAKPSSSIIPPGNSAEIQVTFDSANFSGKVHKSVAVMTNAAKNPKYTFRMEANVVAELQASPRQLSLGPLAPGAAKQVNITITNRGAGSVKILSVNVSSTTLQIKSSIKQAELKPGESGTIELTVTPRVEGKVLSGYVHILTSHPQKKEITIPVYASLAK